MIARCREAGLPEPDFEQRGGEFVVTLWRDWLTAEVLDRLGLTERQRTAVTLASKLGGSRTRSTSVPPAWWTAPSSGTSKTFWPRECSRGSGPPGEAPTTFSRGEPDTNPTNPTRAAPGDKPDRNPTNPTRPIGPPGESEEAQKRSSGHPPAKGPQRGRTCHRAPRPGSDLRGLLARQGDRAGESSARKGSQKAQKAHLDHPDRRPEPCDEASASRREPVRNSPNPTWAPRPAVPVERRMPSPSPSDLQRARRAAPSEVGTNESRMGQMGHDRVPSSLPGI